MVARGLAREELPLVDVETVCGPANDDSHCTGTTLRDYLRVPESDHVVGVTT
jgi:hypothetical protein